MMEASETSDANASTEITATQSPEQPEEDNSTKNSQHTMLELPEWLQRVDSFIKEYFKMEERRVTIKSEVFAGFLHFISCFYVLSLVPDAMAEAGFDSTNVTIVCSLMAGIGSILIGLLSNLPVMAAPPTSIAIFLSRYLLTRNYDYKVGQCAIMLSGIGIVLLAFRPIHQLLNNMIPRCIQYGTAVGIGLLTVFTGCERVNLLVDGSPTSLIKMGPLTMEVYLVLGGFCLIAILLHNSVKGTFIICLIINSIVWWCYTSSLPVQLVDVPQVGFTGWNEEKFWRTLGSDGTVLAFDLMFLYVLNLHGQARAFADLSGLTQTTLIEDGQGREFEVKTIPKGRWLYVICGAVTICSGFFGGPPILISSESGAAIAAGAKTGLSAIIGGTLIVFTAFFYPLLESIPSAALSPVQIAIGAMIFHNVTRVNWSKYSEAFPTFIILFFIPYTAVLNGVFLGW